MAIIYRKRGNLQSRVIQAQLDQAIKDRKCPKCKVPCIEVKTDANTINMYCSRCGSSIRLADAIVPEIPRKKEKNLGAITLRDRSDEVAPKEEVQPDSRKDVQKTVETVRKAFTDKRLIKFTYVAKDGTKSQRTVEGYKLARDGSGELILYGYCLDQENIRMFKLDKISVVEVSDMEYKPRWPVEDTLKKASDE